MLEIKKISVSNFYSLGSISLPIKNGLHYVVGINKDVNSSVTASNGAGKTATFAAIYQGLYNKNVKNPKGVIESVNNSVTGKPYNIQIDFTKQGVGDFSIINDRSSNKIIIKHQNKEIQSKGIVTQLKQIKDILGLDFETFSAITYISQSTLQAILDTTNKDNILYQFFNVEKIHKAENILKDERKDLKSQRTLHITKLRGCEKSLSLLMGFEKVDIQELERTMKILTESLLALSKDVRHTQIKAISSKIANMQTEKASKTAKGQGLRTHLDYLKEQHKVLSCGTCPTCGSDTADKGISLEPDIEKIEAELSELRTSVASLNSVISEYQGKLSGFESSLAEEESAIISKMNHIKSKILVVTEQNQQYAKIIAEKENIELEMASIYADMKITDDRLAIIEECLNFIKNGTLVNEYLQKFRKVFVAVLKELMLKTDFKISIKVSIQNGKLVYMFFDGGIEKGYNDLSAGERTRVSLVLLVSTLLTLEKVTGFSSNYLVIDEMLGVLDAEGIEMVKKFLDIIRKDKAVYLITHHAEIPVEFFDSVITFVKEGGVTTLKEKE